jgi:REP element-mobilizing transposase RayT
MFGYIEGLYFFTATCNTWLPLLEHKNHSQVILDSLAYFSKANDLSIYGFVIMPNHVHFLIGIDPELRQNFQHRFLKYTAQQILRHMKTLNDPILPKLISTQRDRNYQFWERRPKWIKIVHGDIFWQKLKYIHNNPLQEKWKLAARPEDFELSSASSYLAGIPKFEFLKLWEL